MNLRECYSALEGNYENVVARLRSERLVRKFVLKFLQDGSYDLLCRSLEERNLEEAFRAAHTLKGVCQNLDFTKLYESSSRLTDELRDDWGPEVETWFARTSQDYRQTVEAIQNLDEA